MGLHVVLNSSILTFEWEVFPACFISAVISNNNFSRDIDNGRPLELESPLNEHHNIDLMLPCSDDLFAKINITEVSNTTRLMTINIAKMHLAEGENIHVISAQQIQILNTMNGFGQRKVQVICKHVPIIK